MKMYHSAPNVPVTLPPSQDSPTPSNDLLPFACPLCPRRYLTRIKLSSHTYKVHRKRPSVCKFCKLTFSSTSILHKHYRMFHVQIKEGEFACYNCFQKFDSFSESCKHRISGCSAKMKQFTCTECNASFNSQASLDKHLTEHVSELVEPKTETLDFSFLEDTQNTVCNICSKVYCNYSNLRRHVKTAHMQDNSSIKLPTSGQDTRSKETVLPYLDQTLQPDTPSDDKSKQDMHKCFYCDTYFSYKSNRLTHMKKCCKFVPPNNICSNCKAERWPWVTGMCSNCGKESFSRKRVAPCKAENVSKKIKTVETELLPPSSVNLDIPSTTAISKGQNQVFMCTVGKRTFLSHRTMMGHSLSCDGSCKDQAVYCKVCHQLFPNPRIYLRHKPCSGKKNINPATGKRVYRQRKVDHLRILPCEFCDNKFRTVKGLSYHKRNIHNYYASMENKQNAVEITSMKTNDMMPTTASSFSSDQIEFEEVEDGVPLTDLNQTLLTVNAQEIRCPSCLKPFQNHFSVVQHVRYFHKNKYAVIKCSFCEKSILKRHLYEHGINCIKDQLANISTLECVVCSTVFCSDDDEDTLSLKLQEHILNCCGKLTCAKGEKFKNKEKVLCLKCCMLFPSKKKLYDHSFKRHGILVQTSPPQPKNILPIQDTVPMIPNNSTSDFDSQSCDYEYDTTLDIPSPSLPIDIDPKPYHCNRCSKRFKTAKGLNYHKSSVHMYQGRKKRKPDASLKCKSCNRQFYNELKLKNHEKVHGIVKEIISTEVDDKPIKGAASADMSAVGLETISLAKQNTTHIVGAIPISES